MTMKPLEEGLTGTQAWPTVQPLSGRKWAPATLSRPREPTNPFRPPEHTHSAQIDCPPGEHPLETEWTIWGYPRVTGTKITALCRQQLLERAAGGLSPASAAANLYERDLKQQAHFGTVEQFFRVWAGLEKPAQMGPESNVAIFRKCMKPMWEAFPNGGRFVMRIRRERGGSGRGNRRRAPSIDHAAKAPTTADKDSQLGQFVNALWEESVLNLIGENFELPEIVGAVCSVRSREIVISVWVTNGDHSGLRNDVRLRLKQIIEGVEIGTFVPQVLVQFNAFQARLRDQQREVLAQVTTAADLRVPQVVMATGQVIPADDSTPTNEAHTEEEIQPKSTVVVS